MRRLLGMHRAMNSSTQNPPTLADLDRTNRLIRDMMIFLHGAPVFRPVSRPVCALPVARPTGRFTEIASPQSRCA